MPLGVLVWHWDMLQAWKRLFYWGQLGYFVLRVSSNPRLCAEVLEPHLDKTMLRVHLASGAEILP